MTSCIMKDCALVYTIPKKEITKIDFALCKQPKETLEQFYNRQEIKPDLLCNGGFFNVNDGATIFNFVDNGNWISSSTTYVDGFGIKNNTFEFSNKPSDYSEFISAYPVLIKNGKEITTNSATEINYKARRTVLAYDTNNIYLILVKAPGMLFPALKQLLLELKVDFAINLDGGGSTRCLEKGVLATETAYSRPVDNVVCFYLRTIYRVQIGAYSKRANAEKMLAEIKTLPDIIGAGYKNAYIRLINGLYKVQVGAFSKRENAQKVVNDLKFKGYSSFISLK